MAEVRCFANTHHQSLTIEHLKYENELLLNRNHLLAEENSKLLHELEQALKRLESNETHRANRMADEQRRLFEKAKMDCETLFHGMDQKVERLVGGYVTAYRDSLSQNCSIWQLYDCLTSIVSKLLEEKSDVREGQLRELISHTEGRLTLRRQARDKTQRIVHLIRQPPKETQLSLRDLREESEQQRDLYQRIIRKVKRQNVNAHTLQEIYQQVEELLAIRCSIRQEEGRLAVAEREFQLGKFSPLSHQSAAAQLNRLNDSAKELRASIQAGIQALQ